MTTTTKPAEVTATDLRGAIARILRDAEYGHPTTITREGRPVARIVHPDAGVTPAPHLWEVAQRAADRIADTEYQRLPAASRRLVDVAKALLADYYGYEERA